MNLEVVTYRAVEVDTDILRELAGIKYTQGLKSKDLEASILGLFPKYHKLKIFITSSPHDDLETNVKHKTTVCMETNKTSLDVPLRGSATLTGHEPPAVTKEIDRVDGALLMLLEQVGVLAEPSNVCWRTGYFWSEE